LRRTLFVNRLRYHRSTVAPGYDNTAQTDRHAADVLNDRCAGKFAQSLFGEEAGRAGAGEQRAKPDRLRSGERSRFISQRSAQLQRSLLDLKSRFDHILLSRNTLLALPDQDLQIAAIQAAADRPAPGGRIYIDLGMPDPGGTTAVQ
jgi:hypothetical protein